MCVHKVKWLPICKHK